MTISLSALHNTTFITVSMFRIASNAIAVTGCSGEVFAGNTHICCFNTLHEKPATWDEARCCIKEPYNPATHFCCWVTINLARVTPKESWNELGRRSCYNGPI